MPRHIEPLSGGLVTVRDPVALAVGQLSSLQNAIYKPGDFAIHRAVGRDVFGVVSTTATPVRGLRDLKFDNGDHFLLAMQDTTLSSAVVGDTGTFASATNFSASGTALEAIQFLNRWYLFGGGENLVMYVSATAGSQPLKIRSHGLLPVDCQPTLATGSGTWTAGVTGYYEYWFTEILEYTQDGVSGQQIESTYVAKPGTVFVNTTASVVSISIPGAPINPAATKWRLYRSPVKALETDIMFPVGFKLADNDFGTTTVVDGGTTTGAYVSANATGNTGGFAVFATPTNIFSSNDTYATHVGTTPGAVAAAFPTFSITEPVVGITVSIEARKNGGACFAAVSVSNNGGITYSFDRNITVTTSDAVYVVGGDLWGLNWTQADLVAGKFLVRVKAFFALAGNSFFVDHVQAKMTYAGTQPINESQPFPAIVIEAAGVDAGGG